MTFSSTLQSFTQSARKPLLFVCVATVVQFAGASAAVAEFNPTLEQTLTYETSQVVTGEGSTQTEETVNSISSLTDVTIDSRLDSGARVFIELGIDATQYLTSEELYTRTAELTGFYQVYLDEEKKWWLRFQIDQAISHNEEGWAYDRTRIGARLAYKHSANHATNARVRLGFVDQFDPDNKGYSYSDVYADLTHDYRPYGDSTKFSASAFVQSRDAETDSYSYDDIGVRLAAVVPLSEQTTLSGKVTAYSRTYGGAISATNSLVRSDQRFTAEMEISHEFSDMISGFATVGWDNNSSNDAIRSVSNATFGLGVTFTFD